jgi:hypothetical protein
LKITKYWPPPTEFIQNELKTLDAIRNNAKLQQKQYQLSTDAKNCYFRNKSWKNKFIFSSQLTFSKSLLKKEPIIDCAFIGCIVSITDGTLLTYDQFSYSFGLCKLDKNGKHQLVKKFHIDFTNSPETNRPPLHPVFHLQSPGELTPEMRQFEIEDAHLTPSISEPRLCCAPTSLALLTDFLLREFGGDYSSALYQITADPYWKGLIHKNEELVLRPYFEACNGFFHDRSVGKYNGQNTLFTQDFVYGTD